MNAAPELYLFLTCLGIGALLLAPLAWSAGEQDPLPRSRILRRERDVANRRSNLFGSNKSQVTRGRAKRTRKAHVPRELGESNIA